MTCLSATASTRQSTSASPVGQGGRLGDGVRSSRPGSRQRLCRPRFFAGARPPAGGHRKGWWPKRGPGFGTLPRRTDHQVHMATDGRGLPLRIILTPGQRADVTQASALLEGLQAGRVLADKAYDSNALRQVISNLDAEAVTPSHTTSTRRNPIRQAARQLHEVRQTRRNRSMARCGIIVRTDLATPRTAATLITSNLPFDQWTETLGPERPDRRSAGPHYPPRQHARDERRQLSPHAKPRLKGRLTPLEKSQRADGNPARATPSRWTHPRAE